LKTQDEECRQLLALIGLMTVTHGVSDGAFMAVQLRVDDDALIMDIASAVLILRFKLFVWHSCLEITAAAAVDSDAYLTGCCCCCMWLLDLASCLYSGLLCARSVVKLGVNESFFHGWTTLVAVGVLPL